jgi:hypothetical protein
MYARRRVCAHELRESLAVAHACPFSKQHAHAQQGTPDATRGVVAGLLLGDDRFAKVEDARCDVKREGEDERGAPDFAREAPYVAARDALPEDQNHPEAPVPAQGMHMHACTGTGKARRAPTRTTSRSVRKRGSEGEWGRTKRKMRRTGEQRQRRCCTR